MFTHVNGEAIEGWNLNDVVNKLKGPKGTPVDVTIMRPGVDDPMEFTIIRDEITSFSITNKFEIREGIGYIRLANFAETTGQELRDALRDLDAPNLDGLIFDLRGNPGGALPARSPRRSWSAANWSWKHGDERATRTATSNLSAKTWITTSLSSSSSTTPAPARRKSSRAQSRIMIAA